MAMRGSYRAAPLVAVAMVLFFFKHGKASIFCLASAAPPSDGESTRREHQQQQQQLDASSDLASNNHHRQQQQRSLTGRLHMAEYLVPPLNDPAFAAPEQVHIALASSGGSLEEYAMTVSWATWPETQSQVVWGVKADQLDNAAKGGATSE